MRRFGRMARYRRGRSTTWRNPMAAVYLIAVHNVTDPEQLQQYLDGVFALGGLDVLALDSAAATIEGDTRSRAVIVRFPSREAALEFYHSEEYQKVLPLRLNSTSDNWLGIVDAFELSADR
jgi:uncharacterized protein (DUF1330 family)